MKKIFFLLLVIVSINSLGQFPMTQSMATANTKLQVNGGLDARHGIINGVYTDTTAANADYIDWYKGAQIYAGGHLWIRDSLPMRWSRVARYTEIPAAIDTSAKWVSAIWRVPGRDSIYYRIGSTTFAIKDSTGGGSTPTLQQVLTASGTPADLTSTNQIRLTGSNSLYIYRDVSGGAFQEGLYLDPASAFMNGASTTTKYGEIWAHGGASTNDNYVQLVARDGSTKDTVALFPGVFKWNQDTVATLADVRAGGGSGGGTNNANVGSGFRLVKPSTQEIKTLFNGYGVKIDSSSNTDGLTYKIDTTNIPTKSAVDKFRDSLFAILNITNNPKDIYQYYFDISGSTNANMYSAVVGTASAFTRDAPIADNWMGQVTMNTGTATNGFAYMHYGNSGIILGINIASIYRYNYGAKIRLEDLSDGTDTYHVMSGYSDANNDFSAAVDAICFTYTHGTASGQFECQTRSNSVTTTTASGVTVAADTDYELQISVFNNEAKFYINGVLVATHTTNIPSGVARSTSIANAIRKSAGTNARKMYLEWLAYGKVNF